MSTSRFAERSRVLLSLGGEAALGRNQAGLVTSSVPVYYVQPNDDLILTLPRSLMVRRLVIFPRRGPLLAMPVEAVEQVVLDSFTEGPAITPGESLPMSARWISPLKALLFGAVMVGGGFIFSRWRKK